VREKFPAPLIELSATTLGEPSLSAAGQALGEDCDDVLKLQGRSSPDPAAIRGHLGLVPFHAMSLVVGFDCLGQVIDAFCHTIRKHGT
jgi:hypothetical protein